MTGIYASPVGCLCTCAIARHAASHVAIRHATCTHRTGEKTLRATRAAIHACACIQSRLHTRTRSHARTHARTHLLGAFTRACAHAPVVVQCFCATVGVAGLTTRSFRGSTWRRLQPQSHGPTAAMAERTATRCNAARRLLGGSCSAYARTTGCMNGACRRPW